MNNDDRWNMIIVDMKLIQISKKAAEVWKSLPVEKKQVWIEESEYLVK
jgi:hypothetical protein